VTVARLAVDRATNAPVVVLRDAVGDRGVAIWIGAAEAGAIALALQGERAPRPLTVDLLAATITALGAEVESVAISAVRSGTYLAEVRVIAADGGRHVIDARPSDAIALALLAGAVLMARDGLLTTEHGGIPSPPEPLSAEELRQHISRLGPEDFGRFLT